MHDQITLKLTRQEALVFFEWLAKTDDSGELVFQHASEQKVLWTLQGQLESTLHEPFAPSYEAIIAEARRCVEEGQNGS